MPIASPSQVNIERYRYRVALVDVLRPAYARLDGDDVAPVLREQGGFPLRLADPRTHGDHPPAIRHIAKYGFQVVALSLRDSHEEPRGRAAPEPDLALKFNFHEHHGGKLPDE